MRIVFAAGLLAAGAASAQEIATLEESSRVSVLVGWQRDPNPGARTAGQSASRGGPLGTATFGYSPFGWAELGIDLFAGGQPLRLGADAPWGTSYGALVSGRLQMLLPGGPFLALIPRLGVHVGTAVVTASGPSEGFTETLGTAFAGSAGLEARLAPQWSLNVEYRYLLAQGVMGERQVFNGGGHTLLLGATFSFLPGSRGTWSP